MGRGKAHGSARLDSVLRIDRGADAGHFRMAMTTPRVFLSYSHDFEPHREAVLALAQELRAWGIDASGPGAAGDATDVW